MAVPYDRIADAVRQIYDWRIVGPPVLDCESQFPGARDFIDAWRKIRDEALAIAARLEEVPRFHEIMREQTGISANDGRDWRMFILKAYGIAVPQNMAACPMLAALVSMAPNVLSASISFLAPKKHIPPHRGPFRGVLRFYLVLSMPRSPEGTPAAVLKVAGTEYELSDGECLLWDDTYTHEVWNSSNQVRIVLLLDVWRPGMPLDMQVLSKALIAVGQIGIRLRGVP
jgi:aspartate beta-hydroxylase